MKKRINSEFTRYRRAERKLRENRRSLYLEEELRLLTEGTAGSSVREADTVYAGGTARDRKGGIRISLLRSLSCKLV